MGQKYKNNAKGTLNASILAADTTIDLTAGHGARFPALSGSDYAIATLIDASLNYEVIKITARTVDQLTVVRGQDGTVARDYAAGDRIEQRINNMWLNALKQEAATAVAVAGTDTYTATLDPVPNGYTDDQILWARIANSNATTTPTINFSAIGALNIKLPGGGAVAPGDLQAGAIHGFQRSGSDAILINPARSARNEKWGSSIAAAATLNLDNATGGVVNVTGDTAITAITLGDGKRMVTRFTGRPGITASGSLVLRGGASIQIEPGDFVTWRGASGGVVYMEDFLPYSGIPLDAPTLSGYRGLSGSCSSDTQVTYSATELIMKNSAGQSVMVDTSHVAALNGLIADISLGTGPSGLDAGTEAGDTWYYVYAIRKTFPIVAAAVTADAGTDRITHTAHGMAANSPIKLGGSGAPTGTVLGTTYFIRDVTANDYKLAATPGGAAIDLTSAGTAVTVTEVPALVLSTSSSAPSYAALSGYSFHALVGAVRNDGSSNFITYGQVDNDVRFHEAVSIFVGGNDSNAWTAFTASDFWPAISRLVSVVMGTTVQSESGISARSDGYGGAYTYQASSTLISIFNELFTASTQASVNMLETQYASTMYYFTNGTALRMFAVGYKI